MPPGPPRRRPSPARATQHHPRPPAILHERFPDRARTNPPPPCRTCPPRRVILLQPNEPNQPFDSAGFLYPVRSQCPLDTAAAGSPPSRACAGRNPDGARPPPATKRTQGAANVENAQTNSRPQARAHPYPTTPHLVAHATAKRPTPISTSLDPHPPSPRASGRPMNPAAGRPRRGQPPRRQTFATATPNPGLAVEPAAPRRPARADGRPGPAARRL